MGQGIHLQQYLILSYSLKYPHFPAVHTNSTLLLLLFKFHHDQKKTTLCHDDKHSDIRSAWKFMASNTLDVSQKSLLRAIYHFLINM